MLQAGSLALEHFDRPETTHKADASLVTVADEAIEDYLRSALTSDGDGAQLVGEETAGATTPESVAAALSGVAWVVDPIDGTAPYANQLPTWGISLGRMESGRLTDGALFLPRTGELFITSGADVLFHRGARNPTYWDFDELQPIPIGEQPYRSTAMVSLPQEMVHDARFTGRNPMQAVGSAVYSVAKLIHGSYLCYIARIKLWDLAGSIPILRRLGFRIQFADGRELNDTVTAEDWILDATDPRVWKSTGLLFVAHDDETLRYMREHYTGRTITGKA